MYAAYRRQYTMKLVDSLLYSEIVSFLTRDFNSEEISDIRVLDLNDFTGAVLLSPS